MSKLRALILPTLRRSAWTFRVRYDPSVILGLGALILLGATAAAPGGHSASRARQPIETSTPSPGSDPAPGVAFQVSSPSGEIPPRAPSLAEAQASAPILTLTPNEDGWPNSNPIIWTAILTCPPGGGDCAPFLTLKFYSNDGGRFWVYQEPDEPDCCEVVIQESGPYSMSSYTASSPSVFVPAGTQRKLDWSV